MLGGHHHEEKKKERSEKNVDRRLKQGFVRLKEWKEGGKERERDKESVQRTKEFSSL